MNLVQTAFETARTATCLLHHISTQNITALLHAYVVSGVLCLRRR